MKKSVGAVLCFVGISLGGLGGYVLAKEFVVDDVQKLVVKDDSFVVAGPDFNKISSIIDDDLYILNGKKSITELSNQDKLFYAVSRNRELKNLTFEDSFKGEDLKNSYDASALSKFTYNDENLKDYYCKADTCKDQYLYDENTKEYVLNEEYGGHGYGENVPYTKYLKEYSYKDGTYTVSYQYLWGYCSEGGCNNRVYGSYIDVNSDQNLVLTVDLDKYGDIDEMYARELIYNEAREYLIDHYDALKDKLPVYKYSFKKENDGFKLVDFKVE